MITPECKRCGEDDKKKVRRPTVRLKATWNGITSLEELKEAEAVLDLLALDLEYVDASHSSKTVEHVTIDLCGSSISKKRMAIETTRNIRVRQVGKVEEPYVRPKLVMAETSGYLLFQGDFRELGLWDILIDTRRNEE